MRALASIQVIKDLQPIPGADSIEVATVLGWHVVVKKGEFNVGDRCAYFEIDSLLPMIEVFKFLEKNGTKKTLVNGKEVEGYRLRTIRLRGQVSQGLAIPLKGLLFAQYPIGTDITDLIDVHKYEPPVPASLDGIAKGSFPSFIPKTDEMRIQSVPQVLTRHQGVEFYVTEKVDGSSCTIFFKDGELNVCSRNTNWKEESNNSFWRVAKAMHLESNSELLSRYAIQGELVGEGIQGNKLKIKGQKFLLFSVYDMTENKYANFETLQKMALELAIETVPIVCHKFKLPLEVDALVENSIHRSVLNPESWAEGYVFRPIEEMQDEDLGRLSFKVINPEFLLKNGE